MPRLTDTRALISGAASGIGRATAKRFIAEGALVYAIDVDGQGLAAFADDERAGRAITAKADVRSELEVAAAVEAACESWGGLDLIVSCAGVEPANDDRIDRLEEDVWSHIFAVNVTGTFTLAKHGTRALLRSGGGSVILTASPTSAYGIAPDQHGYSASKGAIIGLTKSMAAAYASSGIRVNAVMPGLTNTPANSAVLAEEESRRHALAGIPMGRAAEPEEIAAMMLSVASDDAAYATGSVFVVDGGLTAV